MAEQAIDMKEIVQRVYKMRKRQRTKPWGYPTFESRRKEESEEDWKQQPGR